jgi:hypothetical protein
LKIVSKQKEIARQRIGEHPLAAHSLFCVCVWALVVLAALAGCKSQPEPDNRPGWVKEAEARLQRPPSWQVSGSGVESRESGESRSSFFGSGRIATAPSLSPEAGASQRETNADTSNTSRAPVAAPPGVQWGETQITVSVED